jgi:hypothetical protein
LPEAPIMTTITHKERQIATNATKIQKAVSTKSRKRNMKIRGTMQMLQNVRRP